MGLVALTRRLHGHKLQRAWHGWQGSAMQASCLRHSSGPRDSLLPLQTCPPHHLAISFSFRLHSHRSLPAPSPLSTILPCTSLTPSRLLWLFPPLQKPLQLPCLSSPVLLPLHRLKLHFIPKTQSPNNTCSFISVTEGWFTGESIREIGMGIRSDQTSALQPACP